MLPDLTRYSPARSAIANSATSSIASPSTTSSVTSAFMLLAKKSYLIAPGSPEATMARPSCMIVTVTSTFSPYSGSALTVIEYSGDMVIATVPSSFSLNSMLAIEPVTSTSGIGIEIITSDRLTTPPPEDSLPGVRVWPTLSAAAFQLSQTSWLVTSAWAAPVRTRKIAVVPQRAL